MNGAPLRLLLVEDLEDDAYLLLRELKRAGWDVTHRRVETAAEFRAALESRRWDAVVSDYSLPGFSAPAALEILKEKGLDLPFLIVSRNVGEDVAVAAMKAGAHDYIMKANMARLAPAIERETREARDRDSRRVAERALVESEERYALAARGANDGLWDWDLRTSQVYYSGRWKLMLGHDEDGIGSGLEDWFSRVHRKDVSRVKLEIRAHLAGDTEHFLSEHRMLHKDGTFRWMLSRGLAVRDTTGKAYRIAGSQTDITERKLAEEQLLHDAFHDGLTGLPNRALFLDRVGLALRRSRRHAEQQLAVLFVDLDRFKVVNDGLGHLAGDELLVELSLRLGAFLSPGDTLARFGGDEFTILLEEVGGARDAAAVARRIHEDLTRPFTVQGHEVFTSASIGIALSGPQYERPEELLRDADTAMYRAKAHGKARHEVFDAGMHTRALALLHLETDLRRALDRDELRVYYQPIVSIATARVVGFEALARWEHGQRGLVLPGEFIPVAEESGLIGPIGRWVMAEACRQMRDWHDRLATTPRLTISANLSARQFAQPGLVEEIEAVIAETGLDPLCLRLEITESLMLESAEAGLLTLTRLRDLGLELYVDDFGTGYSSLSYLQSLPIDKLKIDHSFIAKMGSKDGLELVRAIIALAQNLELEVIAEGVETEEQLATLRTLSCEYAQGFLFAVPLPAREAEDLITRERSASGAFLRPGLAALREASGGPA